jgi:RNA polymerase sigma factor (sigma-70 family)
VVQGRNSDVTGGVGSAAGLLTTVTRNELRQLDDDALVARARADEPIAFGELVRRHQRAALRVAAVVSGSTEEAPDIVQEAFVSAHRALHTYRGSGSVRSWLLRIVANHARNAVRGRVRRLHRDDHYAGLVLRATEQLPDEIVERSAEHELLAAALASLATDDRAVLGCRFVAGLGEQETADVLGLPIGTVKSRTSRALARLRDRVADVEQGARP